MSSVLAQLSTEADPAVQSSLGPIIEMVAASDGPDSALDLFYQVTGTGHVCTEADLALEERLLDQVEVNRLRRQDPTFIRNVRLMRDSLMHHVRSEPSVGGQFAKVWRTLNFARRCELYPCGNLDALRNEVSALTPELQGILTRTLFSLAVQFEAAEAVTREDSLRAPQPDKNFRTRPGSLEASFRELKEKGVTADRVRMFLRGFTDVHTITAHPTNVRRGTVMTIESLLADALGQLGLEPSKLTESHPEARRQQQLIDDLVFRAWVAEEMPSGASVKNEIHQGAWFLENRLFTAFRSAREEANRAFLDVFGEELGDVGPIWEARAWPGGDRDGNPYVTAQTTLYAGGHYAEVVLRQFELRLKSIGEEKSFPQPWARLTFPGDKPGAKASPTVPSRRMFEGRLDDIRLTFPKLLDPEADSRCNAQPLCLFAEAVSAKITETRRQINAHKNADDPGDLSPRLLTPPAYEDSQELLEDIRMLGAILAASGAETTAKQVLDPLIGQVENHGFWGFKTEIRENSKDIKAAFNAVARDQGFEKEASQGELDWLRALAENAAPLETLPEVASQHRHVTDVFLAICSLHQELGEQSLPSYEISMAQSAEDVLRLQCLATWFGVNPKDLEFIPLFERREDLVNAEKTVRDLLNTPAFVAALPRNRNGVPVMTIMLGYSDSGKKDGRFSSDYRIDQTQRRLMELGRDHKPPVEFVFFHGRGGAVGRGAPSDICKARRSLPPGSLTNGIRNTRQGETAWKLFQSSLIAVWELLRLTATALESNFQEPNTAPVSDEIADMLAKIEQSSVSAYQAFVFGSDGAGTEFYRMYEQVGNPMPANASSRPAKRKQSNLDDLRAIPYSYFFEQLRLNGNVFYGFGLAVEQFLENNPERGLSQLTKASQQVPWFGQYLDNLEVTLAKNSVEVAEAYFDAFGSEYKERFFTPMATEYQRCIEVLNLIRGRNPQDVRSNSAHTTDVLHDHLLQKNGFAELATALTLEHRQHIRELLRQAVPEIESMTPDARQAAISKARNGNARLTEALRLLDTDVRNLSLLMAASG